MSVKVLIYTLKGIIQLSTEFEFLKNSKHVEPFRKYFVEYAIVLTLGRRPSTCRCMYPSNYSARTTYE